MNYGSLAVGQSVSLTAYLQILLYCADEQELTSIQFSSNCQATENGKNEFTVNLQYVIPIDQHYLIDILMISYDCVICDVLTLTLVASQ